MYIGNMVQGKYRSVSYKSKKNKPCPKNEWVVVEGTHEPIVGRETWERVQELVKQKAKPFDTGKIGIFARKVKCMNCGYTMLSKKSRGNRYLSCATKNIAKDSCIGAFISVKRLEEAVLTELNKLEYLTELCGRAGFSAKIEASVERSKNALPAYRKRVDDCTKAIKDLYLDKLKGIITENDFISFSKEFYAERDRLELTIKAAQEELSALNGRIKPSSDEPDAPEKHLVVEKLTREHVDAFIDFIYVGRKDPDTKELPVEIHWNF
jgi:Holliday junction resolvase RusA-like endonuclease